MSTKPGQVQPVDYLDGSLRCECGGRIRSSYIHGEGDLTALLEGRDPIAVEFHRCTPEVIRQLGETCPTCSHTLGQIGPGFKYCDYCGFHLAVEDDGSVSRKHGDGAYLIHLQTDEHAGAVGTFESPEDRERWMAETLAAGCAVTRAYYTHQSDGAWVTVYLVGSPEEYDWLSPTEQVPGRKEEPVPWPAG